MVPRLTTFPLPTFLTSLASHTSHTRDNSLHDQAYETTETITSTLDRRQVVTITKTVSIMNYDWVDDKFDSFVDPEGQKSLISTLRAYADPLPTGTPLDDDWNMDMVAAVAMLIELSVEVPSAFEAITRPTTFPVSAAPVLASPVPSISAGLSIFMDDAVLRNKREVTMLTVVYPLGSRKEPITLEIGEFGEYRLNSLAAFAFL